MVLEIVDHAFITAAPQCNDTYMFELKAGSVTRHYYTPSVIKESSCKLKDQCYFCLNKHTEPVDPEMLSRYCPQELFSGNVRRMRNCLNNLLEDINCSRNRLRLFKNGVDLTHNIQDAEDLVDELKGSLLPYSTDNVLKEIVRILQRCLLHRPSSKQRSFRATLCRDSLPTGCVLDVFKKAQSLCMGDLQSTKSSYLNMLSHFERDPSLQDRLCMNGPYTSELWDPTMIAERPDSVSRMVMNDFLKVRNYLIYRTTKDSSILVTIQPQTRGTLATGSTFTVTDSEGRPYACQTAIVDLDPKPFSRMERYIDQEELIQKLAEC